MLHVIAFFRHGLFELDVFQFAFLANKKDQITKCLCFVAIVKRAKELFMALYKILANNPYAISDIIILIGQLND